MVRDVARRRPHAAAVTAEVSPQGSQSLSLRVRRVLERRGDGCGQPDSSARVKIRIELKKKKTKHATVWGYMLEI